MKVEQITEYCVQKILDQKKKPLFVGITADSGSGKSYFATRICNELTKEKVAFNYINHDDFLISRKDREPMKKQFYQDGPFKGKSKWVILENMFYLSKFKDAINSLREKKKAVYYPYLRETGEISPRLKTINPSDLNIFDASMMLSEMDFIILIDVTQENIIKRKLLRDADLRTPKQITEMHKKVQGFYWERMRPKNVDIVIDNNDTKNPRIVGRKT